MTTDHPEPIMVKGKRVPWITRWTSEKLDPRSIHLRLQPDPEGGLRLGYTDEMWLDRMDDGILWLREGYSPGEGEPMWADVHSHRQRTCMVGGYCQVCGTKMEPPYLWAIPPFLLQRNGKNIITDVAPTCGNCLALARTQCPSLRQFDPLVFDVADYRPYGVHGDIVHPGPDGLSVHRQADVRMGNTADLRHVMARQMLVELWNFRRRRM